MNSTFSDWKEVRFGVPQGSVPGLLIFNVFVNDIFLFIRCTNICNYADDRAILSCHPTLETIIRQLEIDGTLVAKWFSDNYLRLNDDMCHLMIFGNKCSKATVTIRSSTINQHNLRHENHLRLPVAKTTTYGLETIEYRGYLLWSTLPPEIKDSKSLSEFKRKIKKWDGNSCVCRLCKIFVRNLGFL